MTKRQTLERLADLRQQKMDGIARELGMVRAQLQKAEQQLMNLRQFELEYQQTLSRKVHQGITSAQIIEFQAFLNRLANVIKLQGEEIARKRQAVTEVEKRWLAMRKEKKAFELLAERYRGQEELDDLRRAQKEMDEIAQRGRGLLARLG